jgi:hypothetical protein
MFIRTRGGVDTLSMAGETDTATAKKSLQQISQYFSDVLMNLRASIFQLDNFLMTELLLGNK